MNTRHSTPSGRHLLLVSLERRRVRGALAVLDAGRWSIRSQAVSDQAWPEALAVLASALSLSDACTHALVADEDCHPLLQETALPPGLAPEQAREMLRWEAEAALASLVEPETGASAAGWDIGYQPAGPRRTAIAAIRRTREEMLRSTLANRGIQLAGIAPALSLGWHLLSRKDGQAGLASALVQKTDAAFSLSVFERGSLEFFALYEERAERSAWPANLLADARSFSLQRLLCAPDLPPCPAVPGLPTAEPAPHPDPAHWLWQALLESCLPALATPLQAAPVVPGLELPPPLWQRPSGWWAAAAAVVLLFTLPAGLGWLRQSRALRAEHERVGMESQDIAARLAVFEQDARAHDRLQAELRQLERDIAATRRDGSKPGASRCAQVAYLSDSLAALSATFSRQTRLDRFVTDYQGNLTLGGVASQDATVQDAIGRYYALMKKHPVLPTRLTTTRRTEGALRVLFTAETATGRTTLPPPPPEPEPADEMPVFAAAIPARE